jgi:predicted nicotinamide N-methyase
MRMEIERVSADAETPRLVEHRSRYLFARRFVEGRTVLDVACGSGLGVPLLLQTGARRVVGVESSDQRRACPRNRTAPKHVVGVLLARVRDR